jgi:16S rRNA (guanine966-N2)-methyltransferase
MTVRVVGGAARGRALKVAVGKATRPSSSRVRSALFSILASDLPGSSVLDLYAGTGALGIEALSRGAESADFVERLPRQCAIIKENLESLGYIAQARVYKMSVETACLSLDGPYTVILMDPPYGELAKIPDLGQVSQLLHNQGVIVLEHGKRYVPPGASRGLCQLEGRVYGDTALAMYRKGSASN